MPLAKLTVKHQYYLFSPFLFLLFVHYSRMKHTSLHGFTSLLHHETLPLVAIILYKYNSQHWECLWHYYKSNFTRWCFKFVIVKTGADNFLLKKKIAINQPCNYLSVIFNKCILLIQLCCDFQNNYNIYT